jgi:hypothetical protein
MTSYYLPYSQTVTYDYIFPIGSNVKLSPAETKNVKFVEDYPMNIDVQFGFVHICSFWEEGIWTFSHRVQC